jgi:hypothetical protein
MHWLQQGKRRTPSPSLMSHMQTKQSPCGLNSPRAENQTKNMNLNHTQNERYDAPVVFIEPFLRINKGLETHRPTAAYLPGDCAVDSLLQLSG